MLKVSANPIYATYSRRLQDSAKAGKVIDARVQGSDRVVKKLQRRLQRGY